MSRPAPSDRINLSHSSVLLIDDNQQALDMLSSIFHGFGVKEQIKCGSASEGAQILRRRPVDLSLVESVMAAMAGVRAGIWNTALPTSRCSVCAAIHVRTVAASEPYASAAQTTE